MIAYVASEDRGQKAAANPSQRSIALCLFLTFWISLGLQPKNLALSHFVTLP
jgi:hypothetical protein